MTDNLPARLQYAQSLAASSLLPAAYRTNPSNVLVAMEYGDALGFSPLQAMTLVHVIDNKPTLSAQAIGGLVRKAGHRLRVEVDEKAMRATATIIRADDPDYVFSSVWTMERARAANLAHKNVWKAYPLNMLKARAITEVARDACPEALFGAAYTAEEMGDDDTDMDGGSLKPTVITHTPDGDAPSTVRTIKDAFLEACSVNGVNAADVYEIVGHEDITAENKAQFTAAFNTVKARNAGSPSDPGEGEAAPPASEAQVGGVNDDPDVEASPSHSDTPPVAEEQLFGDGWMVPATPSDEVTAPLTLQQQTALMAASSAVFGGNRDMRMRWAQDVTGRMVTSFKELTEWEAQHMLVRLGEMRGEQ